MPPPSPPSLHLAAEGGWVDKIDELLGRGEPDIEGRNQNGETGLYIAVRNGNLAFAQHLVARGADVLTHNQAGVGLLRTACHFTVSAAEVKIKYTASDAINITSGWSRYCYLSITHANGKKERKEATETHFQFTRAPKLAVIEWLLTLEQADSLYDDRQAVRRQSSPNELGMYGRCTDVSFTILGMRVMLDEFERHRHTRRLEARLFAAEKRIEELAAPQARPATAEAVGVPAVAGA
ncbi:hypothetical protein JKP88DRAFT_274915 [Tribonema minus]|uniref:Ankyrin repeat domain-containing protein n=1 Tax=Tribonema minus TaxID=303371 RepID=A0A835ZFG9_9STRA|nr:hypothetical protein JKP88DRAFT_274915 [Tribonema minus]